MKLCTCESCFLSSCQYTDSVVGRLSWPHDTLPCVLIYACLLLCFCHASPLSINLNNGLCMPWYEIIINGSYFSGTGKGGTSIWNKKFEDEFHDNLKVHIKLFNMHMSAIVMHFTHNSTMLEE